MNVELIICCLPTRKLNITMCSVLNHSLVDFTSDKPLNIKFLLIILLLLKVQLNTSNHIPCICTIVRFVKNILFVD